MCNALFVKLFNTKIAYQGNWFILIKTGVFLMHCYIRSGTECHYVPCKKGTSPLQWRHNGRDNVSNHQPNDCLLNRVFRRRSKKTPKLRVTVICAGNSPVTGEFPAQRASNAENVSIWWRHHAERVQERGVTMCRVIKEAPSQFHQVSTNEFTAKLFRNDLPLQTVVHMSQSIHICFSF